MSLATFYCIMHTYIPVTDTIRNTGMPDKLGVAIERSITKETTKHRYNHKRASIQNQGYIRGKPSTDTEQDDKIMSS